MQEVVKTEGLRTSILTTLERTTGFEPATLTLAR